MLGLNIVVNHAITWFEERPVISQNAEQFEPAFRSQVLQAWATARVFLPT